MFLAVIVPFPLPQSVISEYPLSYDESDSLLLRASLVLISYMEIESEHRRVLFLAVLIGTRMVFGKFTFCSPSDFLLFCIGLENLA